MANFEPIVQWLLYQEDDHREPGKIVDLHDGGGFTRLGLTQRWHQVDLPSNFFSNLDFKSAVAAAKQVYRTEQWHQLQGDLIPYDEVAACMLSFAVNRNVPTAVKTLQEVLDIFPADGKMGPHTLAELGSKDEQMTARLFRGHWAQFYYNLAALFPAGNSQFINGWINRSKFPYPSQEVPDIYA